MKSQIIVFIDYSTTIAIIKQTKLSFNSINKLNLRLMRAFIYLSQFDINVRHKSEKLHVVLDALLRLANNVYLSKLKSTLDETYHIDFESIYKHEEVAVYHVILIEMSNNFKSRLKEVYFINKRWSRIREVLENSSTSKSLDKLRFRIIDNLIYYISDDDERERLCILKTLRKEIFELAHDCHNHVDFHRTYNRIIAFVYIRKLARRL